MISKVSTFNHTTLRGSPVRIRKKTILITTAPWLTSLEHAELTPARRYVDFAFCHALSRCVVRTYVWYTCGKSNGQVWTTIDSAKRGHPNGSQVQGQAWVCEGGWELKKFQFMFRKKAKKTSRQYSTYHSSGPLRPETSTFELPKFIHGNFATRLIYVGWVLVSNTFFRSWSLAAQLRC